MKRFYFLIMLLISFATIELYAEVKIVVLGSSTAAGAGVSNSENAWHAKYNTYIKQFNPSNSVVNLARGGYTTFAIMPTGTEGYQAGEHLLTPDTERNITKAISLNPDAIIINMPTNDVSNGISVEQQMENFAIIINLANQYGIPVWITTSQPHNFGETYTGPYDENNQPDYHKQVARDKFKELTENIITTYGDFAVDFYHDIATEDGYSFIKPMYDSGDGVHLNDDAHDVLFNKLKDKNIIETLSANHPVTETPVFINFGGVSDSDKWNDFEGQSAGYGIEELLDTTGLATSINLYITTGFTHINATSGNESTLMEMTSSVSKSNLCTNGPDPILVFSGLNTGTPYSFKIFASRSGGSENRTSVYSLKGLSQKKDSLDANSNTSNIVVIDSVYANVFGNITLSVSRGTYNDVGFSYINALHIQPNIEEEAEYNGEVELITAGTLSELLPSVVDTITTLKISGPLNGTDIKFIMEELTALEYADMFNSSIVEGGSAYYNGMSTRKDKFPQEMFFNNTVLKSIIIPKDAYELPYHTFMGCSSLETIVIPESVHTFGNDLFSGCVNLENINMPSEMTTLGTGIFYNCRKLKSITLPTGITSIPGAMFYNCNVLESLIIPEGVTSIGQWSFSYCYALSNLELPSTLNSIVENTFYNCSGIETITCKATSIPACTSTPFGGNTANNLQNNATLYVPKSVIGTYSNDPVWSGFKNILPITSTDVEKINNKTLKIYSNHNRVIIESEKVMGISIFDISGKLILQKQIQAGINYINNLEKGVYIINKQKVIL